MDNFSAEKDEKEVAIKEGEDIEFDETVDIEAIQKSLQQHIQQSEEQVQEENIQPQSQIQEQEQAEEQPVTTESEPAEEEITAPEPESEDEVSDEGEPPVSFDETPEEQNTEEEQESKAEINFEQAFPSFMQNLSTEANPNAKKYVVYIDPENIEFMESLSIEDRKATINNILNERKDSIAKQKLIDERSRFTKHLITAMFTLIIGFPILFFIVNKSLELTIVNYKIAQENFAKLYREKGKIQPVSVKNAKKIQF